MASSAKYSSVDVADKLNAWYLAIQNYDLKESHRLKKEVNQLLENMEKNQDVLLYYSLLDFRMQLNQEQPLNEDELCAAIARVGENYSDLTGMLDYYFWLFKGMYAFKQKKFSKALAHYKYAEDQVVRLNDKIEAAHCFYHLAEVYYTLNYPLISIRYSRAALEVFSKNPDYYRYRFLCKSLIGSNFLLRLHVDEALQVYEEAYELAFYYKDEFLIAIGRFNLGIASMNKKHYQEAEHYFEQTAVAFRKHNSHHLPKALCSFVESLIMQGKEEQAELHYRAACQSAQDWKDKEYLAKLTIIHELFPEKEDRQVIRAAFQTLMDLNLFSWVQEYALIVARSLAKRGEYQESIYYFELSQTASKKMLKE